MKKIIFVFFLWTAMFYCSDVFAYLDRDTPYIYIEKPTYGGYASGRDGVQSFTSTQEIVLRADSKFITGELIVDVYKVDKNDILQSLVYTGEGEQIQKKPSISNKEHVATLPITSEGEFSLPVKGNGMWLLHVHADNADTYMYVIRSQYGAVVKEEKDGLFTWVQNTDNGRSAADVSVRIYSLRDKIDKRVETKGDKDGIVHTDSSAKYDVMIVGDDDNGALVPLNLEYLNLGYKNDANQYEGQKDRVRNFVFTDRSLYKPGDVVYFKMISRIDDDITYHVSKDTWKAQILTGWGDSLEVIASGDFTMDSYGTISGEFQLPKDIKTGGDYRLEVTNTDDRDMNDDLWWLDSSLVYLQIENYRKPEYEVRVTLNDHEYINGDQINFDIDGKYFSGGPLVGETVKYVIDESDFWDAEYIDSLSAREDYLQGYNYGKKIQEGTVTLDKQGHAHVSVPSAGTDGTSKVYTVRVSYAPKTGEPVVDQENALVYAGEYGIYRDDYSYSFEKGVNSEVNFVLHGNVDMADTASRSLEISGKRIWWEIVDNNARYRQYIKKEDEINKNDLKADKNGRAVFHFTPQHTGLYELTVESIDNRDNVIKKDFSVWVSDHDHFVADRDAGLTVAVDKAMYDPENSVTVTVLSDITDRDVLLSVERDFMHRYQIVHMDGYTKDVAVNLEDADIPHMTVSASSFGRDRFDAAQKPIDISATSKKLDISIMTDKPQYGPGEEVTIDITAKNDAGKAQKADVTLWAVDKAMYELSDPSNTNIHGAYWGNRHGYTSTTNSLRGIYIRTAEMGGCFVAGTHVLMDGGETKNIEDIRVGDEIVTFDEYGGTKRISARVSKVYNAIVDGYLIINDTLRVTDNHIVWVNGTWKKAGELRIGDKMRDENAQEITVDTIEWRKERSKVFNLTVNNVHTYIADGYFVHNGKGGGDRSIFKDVVYWNPRLRTSDDGKARVQFTLPDDLTTWVISAVGVTQDTIVGDAQAEIHTTKPVIIRPQVPNILREGDKVTLAASAQNNTGKEQIFTASLAVTSGTVDDAEQKVKIRQGESRVVLWHLNPEYKNEPIGLTFALTAEEDHNLSDAVSMEVPIEEFGFWESDSAMLIGESSYDVHVDADAYNDKTKVDLTVSTTKLSSLTGAMNYLIRYPYGCMEQTTSAFMPAVLSKENPTFFAEALEEKDIDDIMSVGVKRLSDKQNSDGGWGWWGGRSDLFLSVYVAEYLIRAQNHGALINDGILSAARSYFENEVVSNAAEVVIATYGKSLFGIHDDYEISGVDYLDADVAAMAVIANVRNGFVDNNTNGYNDLMSKLQNRGNVSFWPAGARERFGSIDASTGIALRAMLSAGGDMQRAARVMQYFTEARKKEYWSSTFATAQILEGFVAYEKREKMQSQNFSAKVYVDDQLLEELVFSSNNTVENISIPTEKLKKEGSVITIKPAVTDAILYTTFATRQWHTSAQADPMAHTISIERSYTNIKDEKYSIGIGDIVSVNLSVEGLQEGDRYLMIEDQLPAGMVPLNEHLQNISDTMRTEDETYVNKEYTTNGVIISDHYITRDGTKHYRYNARVVSGGDYLVPPAHAELMYAPEISTHSGSHMVHIADESQIVHIDGVQKEHKWRLRDHVTSKMVAAGIAVIITLVALGVIIGYRRRNVS